MPRLIITPSIDDTNDLFIKKNVANKLEDAIVDTETPMYDKLVDDDQLVENGEDAQVEVSIPRDWWKYNPPTGRGEADDDAISRCNSPQRLKDMELLMLSNKMITFLSLLALSVIHNDKMLVFSQSLDTLDAIELFLGIQNWGAIIDKIPNVKGATDQFSRWHLSREYLRIDGSTKDRQSIIDSFNTNASHKLLLISTKAGNMGINLASANRIVIFDTSWNPVYDLQATYRAYRYGQKKNLYVYRLIAANSMEEKIYKRQIIKQSLSARVVDAQMPGNHFNEAEHAELMMFNDQDISTSIEKAEEVLKTGPTSTHDNVLWSFVKHYANEFVCSIEDQGVLLADDEDEHLNEEEQRIAEEEDAKENKPRYTTSSVTNASSSSSSSSIAISTSAAIRSGTSNVLPSSSSSSSSDALGMEIITTGNTTTTARYTTATIPAGSTLPLPPPHEWKDIEDHMLLFFNRSFQDADLQHTHKTMLSFCDPSQSFTVDELQQRRHYLVNSGKMQSFTAEDIKKSVSAHIRQRQQQQQQQQQQQIQSNNSHSSSSSSSSSHENKLPPATPVNQSLHSSNRTVGNTYTSTLTL